MSDFIFSKIKIKKKELYDTIERLLVNAGWQNISSNATTDYKVMFSQGESGTHRLCFQLRETSPDNVYNIVTSSNGSMSIRLIGGYTPGLNGAAGTVEKKSESWRWFIAHNGNISPEAIIELYYHVNKNRIIFAVQPLLAFNIAPAITFIGMPDETYIKEVDSRGLVFLPTNMINHTSKMILVTDCSFKTNNSNTSYNLYCDLPIGNNSSNSLLASNIVYGESTAEGIRGAIDGIYCLSPTVTNLQNGTIIERGLEKYQLFILERYSTGTGWGDIIYPSKNILLRVE